MLIHRTINTRCIMVSLLLAPLGAANAQSPKAHHAQSAAYHRLIDPLISVPDFHDIYVNDGAADITVTCPGQCVDSPKIKPVAAVAALMGHSHLTTPLLIDCLSDGRLTHMLFNREVNKPPLRVPVSYVCLDILMARFFSPPVAVYECMSDGLGACMKEGFYFLPDSYSACTDQACKPKPVVLAVQAKWRHVLRNGTLWRAAIAGPESKQ